LLPSAHAGVAPTESYKFMSWCWNLYAMSMLLPGFGTARSMTTSSCRHLLHKFGTQGFHHRDFNEEHEIRLTFKWRFISGSFLSTGYKPSLSL
jgi:hypothetical protein